MLKRTFYIIILFLAGFSAFSQNEVEITRSGIVENFDGKDYYLHFVKKGETLFGIARAYDITVNDIFKSNPGAESGISQGKILKIPVKVNAKTNKAIGDEKPDTYFYHIIKKQETLYGLSKKYGVPIADIKKLNPDLGDYPKEGETLKIPVKHDLSTENQESWDGLTVQHTVEAGETLYGIAKNYNVTTGEIINANPGLTNNLSIGDVILIPNQLNPKEDEIKVETGGITKNRFREYIVTKGETLYQIARENQVSIDSLKKYNPGLSSEIEPGQQIRIPETAHTKSFIIHNPDKKEKLEEIANLYDVEYDEISKINPDINRKAKKGQYVKIPVEPEPVLSDSANFEPQLSRIHTTGCSPKLPGTKKTYNVALMLPLYLEEVDTIAAENITDYGSLRNLHAFRFLDFYAGFQMALDSMKQKGMKVNLFVYDVDFSEEKVIKVLSGSELSSMDLIIGPLFSKAFSKVSAFAKTYGIPIVNPLSEREEIIIGNPDVFKIRPSEEDQVDKLIAYVAQTYPNSNVVLVRHNKYKYQAEVSFIRNTLNTSRPSHIYLNNTRIIQNLKENDIRDKTLTENKMIDPVQLKKSPSDSTYFTNLVKEVIYVNDSIGGLELNLSKVRKNIVIAISDDIVFSKQILSELNKLSLDHDIILFGLPTWLKYEDLETQHLLNLDFHAFTHSAVNYTNPSTERWILDFRKRFKTEPTIENYAFDGFDTGWYFLNALNRFGPDFTDCLNFMDIALLQTQFRFKHSEGNGYRNSYWNLGRYEDYRFRKITFTGE